MKASSTGNPIQVFCLDTVRGGLPDISPFGVSFLQTMGGHCATASFSSPPPPLTPRSPSPTEGATSRRPQPPPRQPGGPHGSWLCTRVAPLASVYRHSRVPARCSHTVATRPARPRTANHTPTIRCFPPRLFRVGQWKRPTATGGGEARLHCTVFPYVSPLPPTAWPYPALLHLRIRGVAEPAAQRSWSPGPSTLRDRRRSLELLLWPEGGGGGGGGGVAAEAMQSVRGGRRGTRRAADTRQRLPAQRGDRRPGVASRYCGGVGGQAGCSSASSRPRRPRHCPPPTRLRAHVTPARRPPPAAT